MDTPNIELQQMLVMRIPQPLIEGCHLSVPGWDQLREKNGLCRDRKRASQDPRFAQAGFKLPYRSYDEECCLLPYERHLQSVGLEPEDPWLIIGIRNLGNNLRVIGWHRQRGLLELNGENASSGREYSCLCRTNGGRLLIDDLVFTDGHPSKNNLMWAASGQRLVWDGKPTNIEEIIPYTYDLRHVWMIPGTYVSGMGGRPYSGEPIEEMLDKFMETADLPPLEASKQLTVLADTRGYPRENGYLHSAIGISQDQEVIILVQCHGSFEVISSTLIKAGAYRAIELDQGGSCSVMIGGTKEFSPGRIIFASHYFRPRGTALLVFQFGHLNERDFVECGCLAA